MEDWSWLSKQGAVGEIPVKIQSEGQAQFLLDIDQEIVIKSFDISTDDRIRPDDVCIFKASIVKSSSIQSSITIEIDVHSIEYVRKVDRQDGTVKKQDESVNKQGKNESVEEQAEQVGRSEGEIEKMMSHLDTAKENHRRKREKNRCSNCRNIDQDTKLTVETKRSGRDLHYCSECNRLVSTKEYEQWLANNG